MFCNIFKKIYEIQAFLCFAIFVKNVKIQNGRHFWRDKNFLKIRIDTLERYPVGQNFHRNPSILHGFQDISIFVFSLFGKFNAKI